jgi:MFS transporter, DHA1 family, multidrug resistance protein
MEPWRKNLYTLWGTQFLAMLGMNLVVPFLPFYIRDLGVTKPDELARWSGLVFSGPFILSLIATPLWGALGDRYGRKAMVVRAIFGLALSQMLIGFSQDVYQLFAFRIVQGAISGFIASSLALVSANTPRERMGYAMGFMQSSTAGGMVFGPFIGGLLADLIGYRTIFFVTASLCAIAGFIVIFLVTELNKVHPEAKAFTVFDNLRLMWDDRRLRVVAFTLIASQLSVLMAEPIFALYIESFKTGGEYISTIAGGIFSIAGFFMIISAPWWGRRTDRMGYRANLAIALGVVAACYVGHLLVRSLYLLVVLRAFLGFARGGILPSLYALTSVWAPPERQGGMMAIASSMTIFGNLLGPSIGGVVAGDFGVTAPFAVNSILLFLVSYAVWTFLRDPVRQPAPPEKIPEPVSPTE